MADIGAVSTRRAFVAAAAALGAVGCMGGTTPEPGSEPEPAREDGRGGKGGKGGKAGRGDGAGTDAPAGEGEIPGVRRRAQQFQGTDRYAFYQDATGTAPVLMAIHGHAHGPEVMIQRVGGALQKAGWGGIFPKTGEDVSTDHLGGDHEFLAHLLTEVAEREQVDPKRRFVLGFSGGAYKTYQLASRHSDLVAGIVICSGKPADQDSEYREWDPNVTRAKPVSILHVHGLRDETVPFEGGDYGRGKGNGRKAIAVQAGLDRWISAMGATPVKSPKRSPLLPARLQISRWEAPSGHAVELLLDPEMGHEFPRDWLADYAVEFLSAVPART